MTVYVFGNPDFKRDSLPLKLLPKLRQRLKHIDFQIKDPNEDWVLPKDIVVLDTVEGITRVTVFNDLNSFSATPRITMHDFDALTNLKYLKKLGKIETIKIIGVPPTIEPSKACDVIESELRVFSQLQSEPCSSQS